MASTDVSVSVTLGSLVDDVLGMFNFNPGPMCWLSSGIDDSTLSVPLAGGVALAPGATIEVDHELMLVSAFDSNSGVMTLAPRGRGWRGSPASAHESGAVVSVAPPVSRWSTIRAINAEVSALFPALMAVRPLETSVSGGTIPLDVETDCVLDVRVLDSDGVTWSRVRWWETESSLPSGVAASGRGVSVPSVKDGDVVQVVVGGRPSLLTSTDDDFTETGLPESAAALVSLGAAIRLLPSLDSYRLTFPTVGNQEQAQLGSASLLVREWTRTYTSRLDAESREFRRRFPARAHYTR